MTAHVIPNPSAVDVVVVRPGGRTDTIPGVYAIIAADGGQLILEGMADQAIIIIPSHAYTEAYPKHDSPQQ